MPYRIMAGSGFRGPHRAPAVLVHGLARENLAAPPFALVAHHQGAVRAALVLGRLRARCRVDGARIVRVIERLGLGAVGGAVWQIRLRFGTSAGPDETARGRDGRQLEETSPFDLAHGDLLKRRGWRHILVSRPSNNHGIR